MDDIGEKCISRWAANTAGGPRPRTKCGNLRDRSGATDCGGQNGGNGVAGDGGRAPAARIITEWSAGKFRSTTHGIGDAFYEAERGGGCSESHSEERRK
ncbi:unannotated protein [freshwater metagenome]|uniref:Unannotated protein n=1 Tax=freshwater metagenome TaxID=449393 RepID=A0A6J7DYQ2_9ZZZZ